MPVMRLIGNWVLVRPLRLSAVVKPAVVPSKSRTVDQSTPVVTVDGAPRLVPSKAAGHGVVGADAEQVAGEGADPGLGDRGAAGQGHEGDLGVVLVAADAVGVAADPEALGGGDEGEGAHAAVTPGVPGQGQAVDRVEGGDALAGDRARAGLVGGEAVVHPALVAADVDRGPGDGHAVEGVAAGVVDPGRLLAGPRGPQLPARGGVAQAAGPLGPGGADHEVATVGADVDVTHVGVEHRGALLLEAGGGPVGDADRCGGR